MALARRVRLTLRSLVTKLLGSSPASLAFPIEALSKVIFTFTLSLSKCDFKTNCQSSTIRHGGQTDKFGLMRQPLFTKIVCPNEAGNY